MIEHTHRSALVPVLFFISLAASADEIESYDSDEYSEQAQSVAEALQTSHRLISRVAENFSCDASYEVLEFLSSNESSFVTRIYSTEAGCRDMLDGLNTWGELYGIRFVLASPTLKLDRDRPSENGYVPPTKYYQTLIHEIDPGDSGQGGD